MTDNYIQLEKSDVLTLKIRDDKGVETGEKLIFDLEDIELPIRYQNMIEIARKDKERLRNQITIIEKRQDVKGKKLLSKNGEDIANAITEYLKKQVDVYNMFLGENGVQKLLNGRALGWTSLAKIDKLIEEQITPYLDLTMENITKKIKGKYGVKDRNDEAIEVLKVEDDAQSTN